ncbi:hypothetical protein LSCM1_04132 [Leishmania martiniquensis]|uniref:FYVE-type domain-containing protein n=1 Tax=Leishmania martiniquensis TaxID=1580590 RepID=A0A836G714_9TRYP|nr:hypothetical protein LSCM1_04132 [Leishmania martiniquensis]
MLHPRFWRADNSTAQCTECAVTFSRFRCRRHHCRHCGGVFCDACTKARLWLRPIPLASSSYHMKKSSPRGAPAAMAGEPPLGEPTTAVRPSPSPVGADSTLSDMSENDTPRSTANSCSSAGDGAEASSFTLLSSATTFSAAQQLHRPKQRSQGCLATQAQPSQGVVCTAHQDGAPVRAREGKEGGHVNCERSRCGKTAMAVGSHHCGSHSEGLTASSVEAVDPARPPASASRPRNEDNAPAEISSRHSVSAKRVAATSAAPQIPQSPLSGQGRSPEAKHGHYSHQVPSSSFSAPQDNSCSSAVAGDVSPQACPASGALACFEQVTSPRRRHGSTASVGGRANECASFMSDSSASQRRLSDRHSDPLQIEQGVMAGSGGALDSSSEACKGRRGAFADPPAGSAHVSGAKSGGSVNDILKDDAYRRESYKISVDTAQRVTWYLCRVCRRCHDHLVRSILDTDKTPLDAGLHGSSKTPLWRYVRLYRADEPPINDDGTGDSFEQRGSGAPPQAAHLIVETSTRALPLWSSMWARLRGSVSLPASRSPSATASPVIAAAATSSPSSLSPLQTRELCQAHGAASRRVNERTSLTAAATQASTGLSGSECMSPVSLEPPRGDDSMLSLFAGSDAASSKMASTQLQSPRPQPQQQPSSSKRARRIATPPRRRLISIDGCPSTLRQAVALARRRRRIAVILIDERDVAGADDGAEAQQQQQRSAQCECPSARPSAHVGAETAPRTSWVAEQLGGTRCTGRVSPITADTGTELPAPQHTAGELASAQPQKNAADDKTAPAAATQKSGQRPKLSILVDDVTLSDTDGLSSAFVSGGGADSAALRGLGPAAWLLPQLPRQAAAPASPATATRVGSPALSPSLTHERTSLWNSVSSSVGAVAWVAAPATSRPISCVPDGSQTTSVAFPAHNSGAATALHAEGRPPALAAALDSGACVLRALFCQIGAAVHFSTLPATTAYTAATPIAAASAAAAGSGGSGFPLTVSTTGTSGLFADPTCCGSAQNAAVPLWGTGPESYAAHRQALVRGMMLRHQLGLGAAPLEVTSPLATALINSTFTVPLDQSDAAHWCGTASQRGAPGGLGSGSGGYMNMACRRFCGCSATASHERVTAPVTTYFQVRPPATATAAAPTAATAGVIILPVPTQVEVVGIPIDTSSATGAAASTTSAAAAPGAVSMGSTGLKSPHFRSGGASCGAAVTPGLVAGDAAGSASRPFTMAEFLPQLAKLSTNLDGYVIVILRRQSSRGGGGNDRTSPGGGATATHPRPNGDSSLHLSTTQMGSDNGISGPQRRQPDGSARQSLDADRSTSAACVSFSLREDDKCCAPRSTQPRDTTQRHRRRHRVTELFGGPHMRMFYQQLQSCGVAQPAISVVEVTDDVEVSVPKPSPVSLATGKSPLEEGGLCRDELSALAVPHVRARGATGGEDGVAEVSSGVTKTSPQNSALSASGMSTVSSVDSALLPRPSSVSTSTVTPSPQTTERTPHAPSMHGESIERLQLPASVCGAFGQTAKLATSSAVPMSPTSPLEHAMASLRHVARQLGVTMCSMAYASETTAAMARGAASATPVAASTGLKTSSTGGSGGSDVALLSRAVESLVATLVYRDINVMLSQ